MVCPRRGRIKKRCLWLCGGGAVLCDRAEGWGRCELYSKRLLEEPIAGDEVE